MAYQYRMTDEHKVEVQQPDGTWVAPMPSEAEIKLFEDGVWRWRHLAIAEEQRAGVPASYQLATVYSESYPPGFPGNLSSDGGTGLNALTHSSVFQGHTREEALDPALNMKLAADVHAKNMSRVGFDVPKLASMYNAGGTQSGPHENASAPWGYNEYRHPTSGYTYISKVVRLNNYAVDRLATCDDCGDYLPGNFFLPNFGLGALFGILAVSAALGLGGALLWEKIR